MLKKSLSQGCWHVLAPLFLLLWHVRERLAFSMRLSRKLIVDAANLAVFKEIFDIAGT
jgi:hypothetical protein